MLNILHTRLLHNVIIQHFEISHSYSEAKNSLKNVTFHYYHMQCFEFQNLILGHLIFLILIVSVFLKVIYI